MKWKTGGGSLTRNNGNYWLIPIITGSLELCLDALKNPALPAVLVVRDQRSAPVHLSAEKRLPLRD